MDLLLGQCSARNRNGAYRILRYPRINAAKIEVGFRYSQYSKYVFRHCELVNTNIHANSNNMRSSCINNVVKMIYAAAFVFFFNVHEATRQIILF